MLAGVGRSSSTARGASTTIHRPSGVDLSRTAPPSSPAVSRRMSLVRTTGTTPEVRLRSILHRRGLRYRIDYRPRVPVRCRLDVAFTAAQVAVLVDGCFWHGCPEHASWPKSNATWWRAKIDRTRERDRQTTVALEHAGWAVIRIWEHEIPEDAADRVERLVLDRRSKPSPTPGHTARLLRGAVG